MGKQHILHIVRQFAPSVGGMENHVFELCQRQLEHGLLPSILSLNRVFQTNQSLQDSETLQLSSGPLAVRRVPFCGPAFAFFPRLDSSRLQGYDCVHLHGLDPLIYRSLQILPAETPRILTTHGGFFHTRRLQSVKNLLFTLHTPKVLQAVDAVIACSAPDFARFAPISPNNIHMIPNGIDLKALTQTNLLEKEDFECVAVLGGHHAHKQIPLLIESFQAARKRFAHLRLKLLGTGLEAWVQDGVSAHSLSREDYIQTLQKARFVLSASSYEGFGLGVAEAMGAGCIPLLSDIPAHQQLLGATTLGRILNFKHPQALSETLSSLLSHPDWLKQGSYEAQKSMRRYDARAVFEEYQQLLNHVMEPRCTS